MTGARVLQEVRPMRVEEREERRQRRTLTMVAAAEILGITERTFRRWSGRDDTEGREGCRTGDSVELRPAPCAGPVEEALRRVTRDETRYTG